MSEARYRLMNAATRASDARDRGNPAQADYWHREALLARIELCDELGLAQAAEHWRSVAGADDSPTDPKETP